MNLKPLSQVFDQCRRSHQALPAFNIDSFEIYQAVEAAVAETRQPCLVQLSEGEDRFVGAERLFMLVQKARLEGLPIYLNMDHGHDLSRLEFLAELGYDMVHFDGSTLDYQSNLQAASTFISRLKSRTSVLVEVEFNHITPSGSSVDPSSFTDPEQAMEFMSATKADLLAVSIGNLHGVNLDLPESLDLDRFRSIAKLLPDTHFTLHGGSGIPLDQILTAVELGVVKININTDLRLRFRQSLRQIMAEVNSEKIYDYLAPAVTDLKQVVLGKISDFSRPSL